VLVNLEEGLGVSLVNKLPEELVFTTLAGIHVHFTRTACNEVLELSVQTIQDTAVDTSPTLQVNAVKVPSELMLTDLFK
ncbi:hypothetical protein CRUP_006378, partial [Coryphaenoides rupestris]